MYKYILLLLLIVSQNLISDELSGYIYGKDDKDSEVPLQKVTIMWLGTKTGTLSDKNGFYKIERNKNSDKLIVRYVGYKTDTIKVSDNTTKLDIRLTSDLTLDEVKVTGAMPESIISKSEIVKSETITSKGLQKAACCNLAESFVTNASVDVEYTDAISGARQIQLLGLQGIYSQMLIENVPDLRGVAAKYGLNFIPGPWMESISISKGTSSVQNGFESIAGQINVGLKKPQNSKPFFANFFFDENQRMEFSADAAQHLSEKLSTSLMVHGNRAQQHMDFNKDGFIDEPLVQQVNLMNRWNFETNGYENVTSLNYLLEDRKGGQEEYFMKDNSLAYNTKIKTNRFNVFTKNGFIFGSEGMSLGTILSYTYHDQQSNYGKNIYNATQNTGYFNTLFQFLPWENHKITTGVSFQFDEHKELFNTTNTDHKDVVPGAYIEYNYSPIRDMVIVGGVRVDNHNEFGTFVTPRLHAKYSYGKSVFRASVGKGFRNTNILAENTALMATSRAFEIADNLKMEEAINYGLNTTTSFDLWEIYYTLNIDYYHTNFINQVVVDLDKDPRKAYFYNLNGQSYSNSFQIDLIIEPWLGWNVTLAYRLNDVKMTIDDKLQQKPLTNSNKGFMNISYSTEEHDWTFDFTIELVGGGRLPNTSQNPKEYQLGERYPSYYQTYAQVTKRFSGWEIYVGGENLNNFTQNNPILSADKPYGEYFDSSIIWGPIQGRKFYMGLRLNLFN